MRAVTRAADESFSAPIKNRSRQSLSLTLCFASPCSGVAGPETGGGSSTRRRSRSRSFAPRVRGVFEVSVGPRPERVPVETERGHRQAFAEVVTLSEVGNEGRTIARQRKQTFSGRSRRVPLELGLLREDAVELLEVAGVECADEALRELLDLPAGARDRLVRRRLRGCHGIDENGERSRDVAAAQLKPPATAKRRADDRGPEPAAARTKRLSELAL